ncbi:Hypothetical_protein [Hexamita inflata]|uniref:Hypothetical_protein n=1 Tax=Hexamita inflata TaxID=28002 RepID=A0ABP1HBH2_9EUKA
MFRLLLQYARQFLIPPEVTAIFLSSHHSQYLERSARNSRLKLSVILLTGFGQFADNLTYYTGKETYIKSVVVPTNPQIIYSWLLKYFASYLQDLEQLMIKTRKAEPISGANNYCCKLKFAEDVVVIFAFGGIFSLFISGEMVK